MIESNALRFFPEEGIYEVLLSTKGEALNVSPIGVRRKEERLYALIYRNTATFSNLAKDEKCGITVSHNPIKFYKALKGELNYAVEVSPEGYPYLPGDAVIYARCHIESGNDPVMVKINPEKVIENEIKEDLYAFSRADSLFIDALVHFTRIRIEEGQERVALLRLILYELATAKRLKPSLELFADEIIAETIKAFKL